MYRAKRTMGADDETVDFAELVRGVSLTVGAGLTACSLLLLGQLFYQGVRYKRRGLGERELRSSLKKYICLFLGCLLSIVGQIRVGLNSSPAMQSGQDLTNVFLSFPSVMLVGCTLFSFSRYLSTVQENKGDEIDTNERLKRKIGMAGVPLGCWTAYNLFPFCVGFFYGLLNAVVNLSGKEDWCEAGADYNGKKCALYFCLWVGSFTLAVMASIYVVYGLVKRGPGVGIVVATVSQLFQLGVVFLAASNEEEEEVGWVWLLNLCGHALNLTILVVVLIGFNVKYSIFEVAFEVSNIEADVWTLRDREEGFIEGKALRNRLSSCT